MITLEMQFVTEQIILIFVTSMKDIRTICAFLLFLFLRSFLYLCKNKFKILVEDKRTNYAIVTLSLTWCLMTLHYWTVFKGIVLFELNESYILNQCLVRVAIQFLLLKFQSKAILITLMFKWNFSFSFEKNVLSVNK